jgi:DNA polymerase alpha subunit B
MQIGREECILSPGDRFSRLGTHLLKQRSFYPLYPPAANVDFAQYEAHVDLPIRPHFMIIPSMFSPFVRKINGTVLINPGYLCKGNLGGTYALLEVDGKFRFNEDNKSEQGLGVRVLRI